MEGGAIPFHDGFSTLSLTESQRKPERWLTRDGPQCNTRALLRSAEYPERRPGLAAEDSAEVVLVGGNHVHFRQNSKKAHSR